METKITLTKSIGDHKATGEITLQDVYNDLITGKYKSSVEALRNIKEEETQKNYKKNKMASWVFGGVFFSGMGEDGKEITISKHTLKKASGYINVDIDHIGEDFNLEEIKERLSKLNGFRLCFISPRGQGIKALFESKSVIINDENYKVVWAALNERYLVKELGISKGKDNNDKGIDTAIKDISRFCVVSYDPNAILKTEEETGYFDSSLYPDNTPKPERKNISKTFFSSDDGIEEIVKRVVLSGINIAPDYADYFPLVNSFADLGERGRELLHAVCSSSPKYNFSHTEKHFDKALKDIRTGIGFGDIGYFINLAKKHNIDVTKAKDYRVTMPQKQGNNERIDMDNINTTPQEENTNKEPFYRKHYERGYWIKRMSEIPEGIHTGYYLGKDKNQELILPSKGLTYICALSGHGKSTLLRNLALNIAQDGNDGDVVYFAFEEGDIKTYLAFLSLMIGKPIRKGEMNINVLQEYYRNKCEVPEDDIDNAEEKLSFLLDSGKLNIYTELTSSSELVKKLKEVLDSGVKIKAVFIDYIQKLKNGKETNKALYEELGKVCNDLQGLVESSDVKYLPIIASAQLSKSDVSSPLSMSSVNMAGSYDISRSGDLIVAIANSKKYNEFKDYKVDEEELTKLKATGNNKMLIRITKGRETIDCVDGVLEVDIHSGKVADEINKKDKNDKPIIPC